MQQLRKLRERARERIEKVGGGGSITPKGGGEGAVKKTIFFFSVLKVPRQCPLVLLVGVKLLFRINSEF
jgi:hypothetical protein